MKQHFSLLVHFRPSGVLRHQTNVFFWQKTMFYGAISPKQAQLHCLRKNFLIETYGTRLVAHKTPTSHSQPISTLGNVRARLSERLTVYNGK